MHDQGVKKQLFLLFQVFNKIKQGEKLLAENEQTKEGSQDDNNSAISVDMEKEAAKQEVPRPPAIIHQPNSRNQGLERKMQTSA